MGLMEQAANNAIGLHGDGGVEVQSQSIRIVEFAEVFCVQQRSVIGRRRILDGQESFQAADGVEGSIDERLQEMIDIETLVLKEAIKGFDIFLAAASLGKGIERSVGEVFKDDAVAGIETFVGKIRL